MFSANELYVCTYVYKGNLMRAIYKGNIYL